MRIYLLALLFISIPSWSQDKGCYDYFLEYCEKEGRCDTVNGRPKIEFKYFCDGIYEALESDTLTLKYEGDPGHVPICVYQSYKRKGILLWMTGDIIFNEDVSHNAGFNTIMKPRIINEIGESAFEELGKIDESWLFSSPADYDTIRRCITVEVLSDTSCILSLKRNLLKETRFKHLDYVMFREMLTKTEFDAEAFYKGVQITYPTRPHMERAFLMMDFSDYVNSEIELCTYFNNRISMVIQLSSNPNKDSGNQYHQSKKKLKWE